jgi:NitT/TauT family transport system permease protein
VAALVVIGYGGVRAVHLLASLASATWGEIAAGLGATFLRVCAALAVAAAWTIPVGLAIGSSPRLAALAQPVAQVAASVPATALFPVVLLAFLHLPGGLDLSAVLLMLLGTQWYLLFNVIAGASAIPRELRDTTALLKLPRAARLRTLWLPALFPYIVTGAITAVGGAWNASIVAEYVEFSGVTHETVGIGATIARATAAGDFALLAGATLAMVVTVVLLNRLFWLRLYRLAEARYRME